MVLFSAFMHSEPVAHRQTVSLTSPLVGLREIPTSFNPLTMTAFSRVNLRETVVGLLAAYFKPGELRWLLAQPEFSEAVDCTVGINDFVRLTDLGVKLLKDRVTD